jgi:hypothetical protein
MLEPRFEPIKHAHTPTFQQMQAGWRITSKAENHPLERASQNLFVPNAPTIAVDFVR